MVTNQNQSISQTIRVCFVTVTVDHGSPSMINMVLTSTCDKKYASARFTKPPMPWFPVCTHSNQSRRRTLSRHDVDASSLPL